MRISKHIAPLAITCCAVILGACASGDKAADDSAAAVTPAASDSAGRRPANISLAQLAGRWNVRAMPEGGTDTTPVTSVLTATSDTTGWTVAFPNMPPQPARVRASGDSITIEVGPYESTRRKGAKVTSTTVARMQGDSLVGTTVARYTTGADSVMRFRTISKRAP